jgi:hypothetical protein
MGGSVIGLNHSRGARGFAWLRAPGVGQTTANHETSFACSLVSPLDAASHRRIAGCWPRPP